MTGIRDIIRRNAIQNRLEYGRANKKAVMGRVISEYPQAKKNISQIMELIDSIVGKVNAMEAAELKRYKLEERDTEEKETELKLPGDPREVVMRFAPNPNGPATLGSARGIIVNSELSKRYQGKFILRFDDTDPKIKKPMPEAYGWYIEDCRWLNCNPDEIYYASDRIKEYYRFAEELIKTGNAYVCFCTQKEFKKLKDKKKGCSHRDTTPKKNLELWKRMLQGEYMEGECVLRIKTDIENKDPALRDWVAFRVVKEEHPRVGGKYVVWPMLDFESAIEDHILGITHIIRGKDLMDSEKRQRFIYSYLGWEYPVTLHWGRIRIHEFGKFSTSKLKKDIAEGRYSGWDDPRIPTLMALRKRGISPKAVRNLMVNLGLGESDIEISMKNLYAENRKIMDSKANRYFFVADPVELSIAGASPINVEVPLHPTFPERGNRSFHLKTDDSGNMKLSICGDDAVKLRKGGEIRLRNLFNVKIENIREGGVKATRLYERNLDVPKIHWVQDHIQAKVVTPSKVVAGYCEPMCRDIKEGDIIQFERFGFVRADQKEGELIFYFAHR